LVIGEAYFPSATSGLQYSTLSIVKFSTLLSADYDISTLSIVKFSTFKA